MMKRAWRVGGYNDNGGIYLYETMEHARCCTGNNDEALIKTSVREASRGKQLYL